MMDEKEGYLWHPKPVEEDDKERRGDYHFQFDCKQCKGYQYLWKTASSVSGW
jgi:hypothetical protein